MAALCSVKQLCVWCVWMFYYILCGVKDWTVKYMYVCMYSVFWAFRLTKLFKMAVVY